MMKHLRLSTPGLPPDIELADWAARVDSGLAPRGQVSSKIPDNSLLVTVIDV
jgi:hypothetical protein